MGFFKDFKDDLSQAVSEMTSDPLSTGKKEAAQEPDEGMMVNTLDEQLAEKETKTAAKEVTKKMSESMAADSIKAAKQEEEKKAPEPKVQEENKAPAKEVPVKEEKIKEEIKEDMKEETTKEEKRQTALDEVAIITKSLRVRGDMMTAGSMEVHGVIEGNVEVAGNLIITGSVIGNSKASEVLVNGASIEGDIVSTGMVKIGQGGVVIGNLTATSAVIAGAVKGNIDVKGPVIVDTTAIVAGDIKSKSMQINTGSVIEGHCSQCYADVTPSDFFKS